eukprot:GHVR01124758.1.p1 GENE.GHVR01124758.1~~GHVR01124758.1.p1  ORF type:complete len:178 (+),score=16.10 GHVR01124758.1:359-892(+)
MDIAQGTEDHFNKLLEDQYSDDDGEIKYIGSVQMLTSFHSIHKAKYIPNSVKTVNFLIDTSSNTFIKDLSYPLITHLNQDNRRNTFIKGRSKDLSGNKHIEERQKKKSSGMLRVLLYLCIGKTEDTFQVVSLLSAVRDNFTLELCQKNRKNWNNSSWNKDRLDGCVVIIIIQQQRTY